MEITSFISISKWKKRAFIWVDVDNMELYKLYDGLQAAAAEAEILGLIDRHIARTMPKYGIGFRGKGQNIDPEKLLQVGFKSIGPAI